MADLPKDNERTLTPPRTEATHKPAGGRHEPESRAEGTRRGDDAGDAGVDRRTEAEASGDGLRRQMANPVIPSVTTMVCVTCGAEQFFDGRVPAGLKCQRCGSMVFRAFDTPTRRDEATIAHLEEESRSVQYGDSSPETAPEDVRDLDMK